MGQPCNPIFESNRECASKKRQLKEILLFNIIISFILTFILTGSPFFYQEAAFKPFFTQVMRIIYRYHVMY